MHPVDRTLPRNRLPTRGQARRPAATLAAVLVCLLVVMLIGGTLVRSMVALHRQTKTELRQLQALWLAESAADLARRELQDDPDYQGQTWRVAVDQIAGDSGLAEIRVQRDDQQPLRRIVRIKTMYPENPHQRVVLEHQITVTLPALGDSE